MASQISVQKVVEPNSWLLLGAPAATSVVLLNDTTLTYSDGTSDVLPANTEALLVGGGTSFDRSADVYVLFVYKGDGILRVQKESSLFLLPQDYAPLGRILHGEIVPYQPVPGLLIGAGNAGLVVPSAPGAACKALSLWNGSSNDAPPASWQTAGFDDGAWPGAVTADQIADPGGAVPAGATTIWASQYPQAATEQVLVRQWFTMPAGVVIAATLQVNSDEDLGGVWINGTLLSGSVDSNGVTEPLPRVLDVPPSLLHVGARNLIAAWGQNVQGAANTVLADATFSDPGGGNPGRTYYTPALAAGYARLHASVTFTGAWSGAGAMEDEGTLWWNALLSPGTYAETDPNSAYLTAGTKRFALQTNNGSAATAHVIVYGNGAAWVAYTLAITYVDTGAVGDPGGSEGAIMVFRAGNWSTLAAGTPGQTLTVGGDGLPAWS